MINLRATRAANWRHSLWQTKATQLTRGLINYSATSSWRCSSLSMDTLTPTTVIIISKSSKTSMGRRAILIPASLKSSLCHKRAKTRRLEAIRTRRRWARLARYWMIGASKAESSTTSWTSSVSKTQQQLFKMTTKIRSNKNFKSNLLMPQL